MISGKVCIWYQLAALDVSIREPLLEGAHTFLVSVNCTVLMTFSAMALAIFCGLLMFNFTDV